MARSLWQSSADRGDADRLPGEHPGTRRVAVSALLLRRHGYDPEDPIDPTEGDDPALAQCQAAAVQGRIAFGPQAGQWAQRAGFDPTAVGAPEDRKAPSIPKRLCANDGGFSLHAKVRVGAVARRKLERLCRYAARGPIASGRLSRTSEGKVLYRFKRPFRDGTTHVVLSPTEFIERLAAQMPPPRRHLLTYHGVLAPAAGYRDQVVPENRPYREAVHRHRRDAQGVDEPAAKRKRRPGLWAELLRRTFGLDVLHCPLCGGRRELIALIAVPHIAQRILKAMNIPADAPVLEPARPPPEPRLPFAE